MSVELCKFSDQVLSLRAYHIRCSKVWTHQKQNNNKWNTSNVIDAIQNGEAFLSCVSLSQYNTSQHLYHIVLESLRLFLLHRIQKGKALDERLSVETISDPQRGFFFFFFFLLSFLFFFLSFLFIFLSFFSV